MKNVEVKKDIFANKGLVKRDNILWRNFMTTINTNAVDIGE